MERIGIGASCKFLICLFGCFFKKDFTSSSVIAGSSSFAFLCVACVLTLVYVVIDVAAYLVFC